MEVLIFFTLGLAAAAFFLPLLIRIIAAAGHVGYNYRGDRIPVSVGVLFFIVPSVLLLGALNVHPDGAYLGLVPAFVMVTGGMSFLGLIDDLYGSRRATGLRGHLRRLLHGEFTTGALKAIGGLVIAFVVSWATTPTRGSEVLLNTLVIALAANALNLLDLRPGRAGKGFLLGSGLLFAAAWGSPLLVFPAVVTGSLTAYLPTDLRARGMMGDAGANVLGVTLGLTAAWVLAWPAKLGVLAFLISLHLFTERYSLTEVIVRNRVLDFVDRLGRKREDFSRR